jgi:RHS repeat-associated protein
VPSGWSGSVTPTLAAHSFTPASRSYTNVTACQSAQNYTAVLNPVVSGMVSLLGSPLAGVSFSGTNGSVCSASNASGQYSCNAPPGWSGTITPSSGTYAFTPGSRNYTNVSADQSGENYAVTSYPLSGTASAGGLPLPNVVVSGTNGAACGNSNASGHYTCTVLAGWSGTLTPALSGYTFTPADRSYTNVGAPQTAQDFAAAVNTSSTRIFFVHPDHLNTPRLVSDATGTAVWRWDQQEPFGVTVPDENPSGLGAFELPLRFPGQYADKETSVYYNYFRDYDPAIGKYVQSDPIGLGGGINTYAYVLSKPTMRTDFLGLWSQADWDLVRHFYLGGGAFRDISNSCADYLSDPAIQARRQQMIDAVKAQTEELAGKLAPGEKQWYSRSQQNSNYLNNIFSFGAGDYHVQLWGCTITGLNGCCAMADCRFTFNATDLFDDPMDQCQIHRRCGSGRNFGGTPFWFGLTCRESFSYTGCKK